MKVGSDINLSEFVAEENYTWFKIWDSIGENNFELNGNEINAKNGANIRATDLVNTILSADNSPSTQNLFIRGWDGESWTSWDQFTLSTTIDVL